MAKNSITDYSKTAASNTDIQSVDIDEGCLPSGINNAIRELMADLADMNDGTVSLTSPSFAAASLTGNLSFGDDNKAIFGAGSDLQIYHDGSNSYVQDAGTGDLILKGAGSVFLKSAADEVLLQAIGNGAVKLNYDNATKLFTTATGIDVNGTVTADGLTLANNTYVRQNDAAAGLPRILGINSGNVTYVGPIDPYAGGSVFYGASANVTSHNFFTAADERLRIANNGDISFYEDTGTTAKFFWDASAERLGLGTSSVYEKLTIGGADETSLTNQIAVRASDNDDIFRIRTNNSTEQVSIEASGDSGNGFMTFGTGSGSAERLRITSAGLVGIGTSSPDATLQVVASTTNSEYARFSSTDSRHLRLSSFDTVSADAGHDINASSSNGVISFSTGSTERLRITSAGLVGINRTSPNGLFHMQSPSGTDSALYIQTSAGTDDSVIHFGDDSASSVGSILYDHSTDSMQFETLNSERARLDSSGNLLVGTTSSIGAGDQAVQLTNNGQILTAKDSVNSRNHISFVNPNGVVGNISTSGTTTTYGTSSDQRLKENIADADDAGSKIDAVQVRQFDWKADGSHQDYGMIAQELQAVAPEAVSGDADSEEMMGVDYSKLVPMLIKEIQSLRNRVSELEGN